MTDTDKSMLCMAANLTIWLLIAIGATPMLSLIQAMALGVQIYFLVRAHSS